MQNQNQNKIYVYAIYFPTSDKYYIGQTYNMKVRMSEHIRNKRKNPVGNAFNKYNNWQIEILHICKTRDIANTLEIEEIRHYNCVAPNGYNLTAGGDGVDGYKHTEEWKQNQSKRLQGNQHGIGYRHTKEEIEKLRSYKHTKEAKEKIRQAGRRPCSKETKEKIRQGNLGKIRPETTKRNKENNPMWNSKTKLKCRISKLKATIKKLEKGNI